jgi:hypothetical protein
MVQDILSNYHIDKDFDIKNKHKLTISQIIETIKQCQDELQQYAISAI